MSDYTNIDLFRIYSGTTFAFLYEAFPLSTKLNAGQLVEHCDIANDQASRAAHELIVRETWRWLIVTGYLRYDTTSDTFDLTPKSFEGLTFLDDATGCVCRGDKLRQLSRKAGVETASETMAEIVTSILGSGTRAALSFLA